MQFLTSTTTSVVTIYIKTILLLCLVTKKGSHILPEEPHILKHENKHNKTFRPKWWRDYNRRNYDARNYGSHILFILFRLLKWSDGRLSSCGRNNICTNNLVNETNLLANLFLVYLYLSISIHVSGDYGPFIRRNNCVMQHLVLVILCGWLSGMQGGIPPCIPDSHPQLFLLMMGPSSPKTCRDW